MANVFINPEVTANTVQEDSLPYYNMLAQCVNCKTFYPIHSTHAVALCANCLELEDAQSYKVEKEVEISKD